MRGGPKADSEVTSKMEDGFPLVDEVIINSTSTDKKSITLFGGSDSDSEVADTDNEKDSTLKQPPKKRRKFISKKRLQEKATNAERKLQEAIEQHSIGM